jgi:hypothetical protein
MTYVLYHSNCADGLGAKLSAWLYFKDGPGSVSYLPVNYGQPVPDMEDGSCVYILDFSYPRDILETLNARMTKVVVLDHHKSAAEDLRGLDYAKFDMDKSGAMLAWEYFHPGVPPAHLIKLIQDRDLWKFEFPESKPVHSGILACVARAHREEVPEVVLLQSYLRHVTPLRDAGVAIEDYKAGLINTAIKSAIGRVFQVIPGRVHKCAMFTSASELASDACDRLLNQNVGKVDFAISYLVGTNRKVFLSIRSKGDNDSAELAKILAVRYGEGGGPPQERCRVYGRATLARRGSFYKPGLS